MSVEQPQHLILLPGLDGTGELFRPLLEALPERVQPKVIAYPADVPLSVEAYATVVENALPENDVVLLAESFSGLIALELLARHRPGLRKVLFVASFAAPPRPLLLGLGPLVRWSAYLARFAPAYLLRQFCLGNDASAAQLTQLREALAAVPPALLAHRLEIIAGTRIGALQVNTPCAYLQAKQDRLVPSSARQWFEQQLHSCDMDAIDGPHFLLQARPRECARWVVRHLDAT